MSKIIGKHLIIEGLVQGVGYRYYVLRLAKHYTNCSGYVKNLYNGSVEVVVEGPEEEVKQFIISVKEGPSGAIVRNVIEENFTPQGNFVGFKIAF